MASGSLIQIGVVSHDCLPHSGCRTTPIAPVTRRRITLQLKDQLPSIASWRPSCKTSNRHVRSRRTSSAAMDLNTITEVVRPRSRTELPVWTAGDAWLAGGTWLFSEPQVHLSRLIDLTDLDWPALTIGDAGLTIAATCTVAELDALACPPDWPAAPLISQCCRAFLASFKIWKTATVGGNLCMSLPAGPMISLTGGARRRLHDLEGGWRRADRSPVADFVTGDQRNVLGARRPAAPDRAAARRLKRRAAFRQISLTPVGRSAALLIGTSAGDGAFAADRDGLDGAAGPDCRFSAMPDAADTARRRSCRTSPTLSIMTTSTASRPGARHMTLRLAEEIRSELARACADELSDQRQDVLRNAARRTMPAHLAARHSAISASRRAATPATAAPAPCCSTASRCIAA